jgi:hypothetical protein
MTLRAYEHVLYKLVQVLHATADSRAIIFAHAVYRLAAKQCVYRNSARRLRASGPMNPGSIPSISKRFYLSYYPFCPIRLLLWTVTSW